jgi:hypothetical protein
MSKRVDFAKKRKTQGRSFSAAVSEITALMQPLAKAQGVDLQERLKEGAAQRSDEQRLLAERLQDPVVPLFIDDGAGPDRIGSCVLVRLASDFFAFTAAHVVRDVGSALLLAPSEARGGRLLPLPPCTAHLNSSGRDNDLDVGVLVLPAGQLGPFTQRVFLAGTDIDQDDLPDDQAPASFYFVLGYSASRTQVKVSHAERQIHQQSFHCTTSPVEASEYEQEGLSPAEHILLDFDHDEIVLGGKRIHPPKLQGVSGGGIFHISRETRQGPLVAIATQNRRRSRLIVGTRIRHFLTIVRQLKATSQR